MIYTVGEMAQKLGVPASTLRYYCLLYTSRCV